MRQGMYVPQRICISSSFDSHGCFQNYLKEFEKLLSNATKKRTDFTIIEGDFNA